MNHGKHDSKKMLIFGVDSLPVPAFAVDVKGCVIAWNRWISELTGVEATKMIGKGDFEYALPFYGKRRPILIDFALSSDVKDHDTDYVFLRKDSLQLIAEAYVPFAGKDHGRRVLCCANPVYDVDQRIVGAVETVEDVSVYHTTIETLQSSLRRWRRLSEKALSGLFIHLGGKIVFINEALASLCGYAPEEISGISVWQLVHPQDRSRFEELGREVLLHQKTLPAQEIRFLKKEGDTVDVLMRCFSVTFGFKPAVAGSVIMDAPRRPCSGKRVPRERNDVALCQVQKAQEDERKRIARDLHDTILQRLGAVKLRLGCVSGHVLQDKSIACVSTMVEESIDELRKIIEDLRPADLDRLGISAAVERYCKEFQENYGGIFIESLIEVDELKIPDDLKTAMYRITQEALNNIAKHSRADYVKIDLRSADETFELIIDDNGDGFDPDNVFLPSVCGRKSLGLLGMKERTELLGGDFIIRTSLGKGTRICAKWPKNR